MPRANRIFIPGMVWHVTHRCHKKEFLLKFARDRRRWLRWLFEAKKRYDLTILNYVVTSNHIHLLALDEKKGALANSIQLAAGRTAQEYNIRKKRKGAFWEDRYHATAIETGEYLQQCLIYIDLNMVRAGVIDHPSQWSESGYEELQNPPERYRIIDQKKLCELFGFKTTNELRDHHKRWIADALKGIKINFEKDFSQRVAIGSEDFVFDVAQRLGYSSTQQNQRTESGETYSSLRELEAVYHRQS